MFMCLKIGTDSPCCSRSYIFDRFECCDAEIEIENILNTLKQWCEEFRSTFTDSWDSERSDKSINRECAFCFDSSEEIIDRFFFVSLDEEKLITILSEIIDRRHVGHPSEFEEELDLFWSESIDIHTMLADEPFEGLHLTSWTVRITTEESDFFTFFVRR